MVGSDELKPIVYRGAQEICSAVGIPWKEIGSYVKEKKLPAFKIDGRGIWLAVPDDLNKWILRQRDENIRI